jgi:hypothetical protein
MGYDASQYVTGQYLNAQIAKDTGLTKKILVILNVEEETFTKNDKEQKKLSLKFDSVERKMPLNSKNTKIMIEEFGPDTDKWIGKKIRLVITKESFKGSLVDSLQVSPEVGGSPTTSRLSDDDLQIFMPPKTVLREEVAWLANELGMQPTVAELDMLAGKKPEEVRKYFEERL